MIDGGRLGSGFSGPYHRSRLEGFGGEGFWIQGLGFKLLCFTF